MFETFVALYCNDTTASEIVHAVRNVFFCINIIVFCALEPLGCSWNISSADHSIVESDVLEIVCEVRYAGNWWTPVIQCLPARAPTDVGKETVNINSSVGAIEYRNSVNVTSWMDGWQFKCQLSFETTSDSTSSSSSIHAPDSIHLWTSPVIYVKGYYFIAKCPIDTDNGSPKCEKGRYRNIAR